MTQLKTQLTNEEQTEILETVKNYCNVVKSFRDVEKEFLWRCKTELHQNVISKNEIEEIQEQLECYLVDDLHSITSDIEEVIEAYNIDTNYLLNIQTLLNAINNTSFNFEFNKNDIELIEESQYFYNNIKEVLKYSFDNLINESVIDDYIEEEIKDAYSDILDKIPSFIDWSIDIDALKYDYNFIEILGNGYWYR